MSRAGYWVATDQSTEVNTFHVFDRTTLAHAGSFRGRTVLNTDGIALTQTPFDRFPQGSFFAVDNDGAVAAFRRGTSPRRWGCEPIAPRPPSTADPRTRQGGPGRVRRDGVDHLAGSRSDSC